MKYYLIAGEASGDLHGSNLMKGLYANDKEADCRFWGGALMDSVYKENQAGSALVHDYKEEAVMGFSQVVLNAGRYFKLLQKCKQDILEWKPDVLILIDYPGFNFKIAKFAHNKGFKVFYYIAPKVWASRESRLKQLKSHVDRLFIIFPFEKEYFAKKGIEYIYAGNPTIDSIDLSPFSNESAEGFMEACGLEKKSYIAILAGSRKSEIAGMMPVCMKFADMLREIKEYSDYSFIIAGAPARDAEDYAPYIKGREKYVKLVFGRTYPLIKYAEAAVVNSGTASLETCLLGTPQVVGYSGAPLNFAIGKKIIKIEFISLGNLILGRKAFKELMQYYFTPENLLSEVRRLIEDKEYRENMLASYKEIREALGGSGASMKIAQAMINEIRRSI